MESSRPFKKTALSVGAAILLGLGLLSFQHRAHLRVEQRRNEVLSETNMLRDQMRTAYLRRGVVLRSWAADAPRAFREGFESLIAENERLTLKNQLEFDRYEWIQDQISRRVVDLLRDKKTSKKRPAEWDKAESDAITARENYSKRAVNANRYEDLSTKIPVFKSDAALAPDPGST